ncbi:tRNA uridine-5-carboxymethylaminomethyl(34) synthesis GTPase MnmE [Nitratifractor sp.]
MNRDTIVALSTAPGAAAIAIVRLSGPEARTIAARIAPAATFAERFAQLCTLYDAQGEAIDRGIVLYFAAPRSFTGEEVVEFQSHGGMIVAEALLEAAKKLGARLAEPGEFSKRAFLNGKIDLSEAEAIARMIEARSRDAARILARQMRGELSRFVEEARSALLEALAHAEVMIDYAEEDLPDDLLERLRGRLEELRVRFVDLVASSRRRRGLIEGFRVAIVGKPNVGKSSLLNALLRYERAIVSEIAGTTRDTIEESIRIGTYVVRIVDTAGIRNAADSIERIGVERSIESVREADIVIALFDRSRPLDEEDHRILELIETHPEKEWIVALNKSDLPPAIETDELDRYDPIPISAKGEFSGLIARLEAILNARGADEELMLTSERQIEAIEEAARQIGEAAEPLNRGELELFSYHLTEAIRSLASITRPLESGEILDRMFSEFCLGK